MSKSEKAYAAAKAAWQAKSQQAIAAYEAALQRPNLTDKEVAFLRRSIAALHNYVFPAFHPGAF